MARGLKGYEFRSSGRKAKYPWEQWLDGEAHRLHRGQHFKVSTIAFQSAAHGAARSRGLTVRTNIEGDSVIIQSSK